MKISLKGTSIKISQPIKDYLDEKIVYLVEKLIKKNNELLKLDLEVSRVTKHHKHGKVFRAEANLTFGSKNIYADAIGEDLYEAIDLLEEEFRREIKKFKGKIVALELRRARTFKRKR